MSEKSGVAEQIIALPKGGGALKGLGEKFQPNPHTGTGNFSVPIEVPPGRNGFQPQLTLTYSTGSGNGAFGLGWNLNLPTISRKTSQGIPRYREQDTFILSGAEDLVMIKEDTSAGINRRNYRPRTEGLFARIIHITSADLNQWEVTSKDGLKSIYGKSASSRVYAHSSGNPDHIFQWLLSETEDTFGNRIVYTYKPEDEINLNQEQYEGNRNYNQVYLSKIEYMDYLPPGSTQEKFLFAIAFDYGEYPDENETLAVHPLPVKPWACRPDPFSSYRAGFEIRSLRRCRRVLIKLQEDDGPPSGKLTKTYSFQYLDELPMPQRRGTVLPLNRVSLLAKITLTGYRDLNETESMPPLEFQYTNFDPESKQYETLSAKGGYLPERALNTPEYELIDLHGYGLPDIVHSSPAGFRYWRNLGNCRFDQPRLMPLAPAGLTLADPGVQFADMEGNGSADLLVTNGPVPGYYPTRFDARWDPASFKRYQQAPSFNLKDPNVKLLDMDGDGVIDALETSDTHFLIYYNKGPQGWDHRVEYIPRRPPEEFPNVTFSAPEQRVRLAAMSGDGLQDIVLIHNRLIQYWPNLGYGHWGRRITMFNAPQLPPNYDLRRLFLADIDGDGYADLVYIDYGRVHYWINQSGNAWSEEHVIEGTPAVSDMDAVRITDMKGSGTAGILWTYDYSEQNHANYKFLDLTGGVKPYLLNGMDNNIGAVTRIEYASSTKFAIADREGGHPWQTHLPFPVQVVERVELSDCLSKGNLVTRYAFHHGYWDGAEREFRGFGMVEQYDAETFKNYPDANLLKDSEVPLKHYSPPTLTRTWFHQGPIGNEFQWGEADYRSEYWSGDPQMFSCQCADFPTGLPRRAQRDALRVLQGNILRTELYSQDNNAHQDRPYTVTEHRYGVREESPPAQGQNLGGRVFFAYPLGRRTTQWERGDDPLTRYEFTNDYDEYGQPRQQTSIVLPRRFAKRQPLRNGRTIDETRILATHIYTEYALPDPGLYINNRIAHLRTFELENPPEVIESDASDIISVLKDQAAATQALHEQFQTLLEQWQAGQALPPEIRLIGHLINHYDGDNNQAFTGRRAGVVGPYGALTRSESLVFTDAELAASYGNDRPSYLGGNSPLPEGVPADFGLGLGYRLEQGSSNGYLEGYYSDTKRQKYDFQEIGSADSLLTKRGIVVAAQDALGHITTITPDAYWLLPKEVTDPVGLRSTVDYDYRVLQPREVTDPNGNRTSFSFTPLGLLEDKWVRGKNADGDQQHPSLKLSYNFSAYMENKRPVNVRTLRRVYHDTETDVPLPERDETIQTIEYSDGFGRLLQTRTQSENIHFGDEVFGGGDQILPANQAELAGTSKDIVGQTNRDALNPNVVVNGWQVYDNKGQVVEKYEPFYSVGWNYSTPTDCLCGQKATLYYDPLGRMFRTVNPDSSELLVVHGIPFNLAAPAQYAPSPWETYTYDANDNAGRTLTADSRTAEYQHHWNTPASAIADALGRTITTIERNRDKPGEPLKPAEDYISSFTYDGQGNLLTVTDALGRVAFKYEYDLSKRLLRVESLDAGTRLTVLDAVGNPVEHRDSKGSILLRTYDLLNRPLRLWARNDINSPLTLRERLEYGDGSDPNQLQEERTASQDMNRLARLSKNYDEAGLLSFEKYDFKGNNLVKLRRVIQDEQILNSFDPCAPDNQLGTFPVDWEPPSEVSFEDHVLTLLDPVEYKISLSYDALNRVKTMRLPEDVASSPELPSRKILHPHYNRAGNLESIKLDDQTYVEHIAYNAKGQRTFIAYGNNVLTRYAYHPQTFRLVRMRTERYAASTTTGLAYHPIGTPLQDFAYRYDLAGNILSLHNRTPKCGVRQADTLDRQFIYDAVYRLISATGREEDLSPPPEPWGDKVYSTDPTLTRGYSQSYSYDPSGNMVELNHQAGTANCYKRLFNHMNGSNRLSSVKFGNNPYTYQYDLNGNISKENTERHFAWDHSDRLITFTCRPSESTISSLKSHYLYDASGQRVKKLVQKQGGEYEVTVYIDGIFEYHRLVKGGEIKENNTLHIMDNQNRIALVRVGAAFPNDEAPEIIVKYQLPDHLGSSNVVIGGTDGSANHFINYEEYYPYGETSFGSFAHNRYRFTGKERDEESGLYYHGARYYAPWLTRWISCDPEKTNAVCSKCNGLYVYGLANPLITVDPNGREDIIVVGTQVYSTQLKNPANKFNFMHQAIRSTKTMPSGATVLLFTEGYTKEQIDKFTTSIEMNDGHVLHLSSAQDLVDYINRGLPDKYGQGSRKQDPVRFLRIFSHGLPGEISFGFQLSDQDKYSFNEYHVKQLDPKAFAKNASIHSYACRTAAPVVDNSPEENLAQWIADQTKAETSAFEYRTTYEGSLGFEGLIGADQQSVQESMARQIMVDGYPFDPEGAVVGVYSQHGPMKTYLPRRESQQEKE